MQTSTLTVALQKCKSLNAREQQFPCVQKGEIVDESTALTTYPNPPSSANREEKNGAQPSTMLPADATDELVIGLWLRGKRSAETKRAYQRDVECFLQLVGKPLRGVTLPDLYTYAESLSHLKPATVNRRLAAIKSLFTFATKTGYLPVNIGAAMPLLTLEDTLAEHILTQEEVLRLLAYEQNPRNHALLRLLYGAGLRVSEVCGLTWEKLHAREGRGQITVFGKGRKTRHVLLSEATWQEIMILRGDASPDGPVFLSRKRKNNRGEPTNRQLDPSEVRRIIYAAAKRAGLAQKVSPHWMRHAHISHALDKGAPPHLVQQTVGHKSLDTTTRYSHVRPDTSSSDYLLV